MSSTVGVIVGRFQEDELHDGHRALINEVSKRHPKVLILIGCTPVRMTREDPLDYQTRERMVRDEFPEVTIAAIEDKPSDKVWSEQLDDIITKMFPLDKATLYGSRDSFIPHYKGSFKVHEIEQVSAPSATQIRERVASRPLNSRDFRAGVIYASQDRFPISYPTVDIAVVGKQWGDKQCVILGRKSHDNGWRFPGGFIDRKDVSFEKAAQREFNEEVPGLEIADYRYVGSYQVNDWRYRGRGDGIITAFFVATFVYGHVKAGDDLDEVRWVPLDELPNILIPEHQPLGVDLLKFLGKQ